MSLSEKELREHFTVDSTKQYSANKVQKYAGQTSKADLFLVCRKQLVVTKLGSLSDRLIGIICA